MSVLKKEGAERLLYIQNYDSPCGPLLLGECGGKWVMCYWKESLRCPSLLHQLSERLQARVVEAPTLLLCKVRLELDNYFARRCRRFSQPYLCCGTDFQKTVWRSLLPLPYGCTVSYRELALRIGRPSALRALAGALGANPLQIVIPCHRIVGADGKLTGYAGGFPAKRYLLRLEQESLNSPFCL